MPVYPALSAAFRTQGAGKYLIAVDPDSRRCSNDTRGLLHDATRRALACVNEVEVMTLICRLEWEVAHEVDNYLDTAVELASYAQ